MSAVLLPCPFCGGKGTPDKLLRDGYDDCKDDPDAYAHFIRCVSCAATGGWGKSASSGAGKWNMRTPSSLLAQPSPTHGGGREP